MTALTKPVSRKSNAPVATYGPDGGRRIVVTLLPGADGDMIELRPSGTRRAERILLTDLWSMLLRSKANLEWRERMEAKKAAKKRGQETRKARAVTRKLAREVDQLVAGPATPPNLERALKDLVG